MVSSRKKRAGKGDWESSHSSLRVFGVHFSFDELYIHGMFGISFNGVLGLDQGTRIERVAYKLHW